MYGMIKILFMIILVQVCNAMQLRTVDLTTAWHEGKFSGLALRNVTYLTRDGIDLSDEQKLCLVQSKSLVNLKVLDLSKQNVTDNLVEMLCQNPVFHRLVRINLSYNEGVSERSLQAICNSQIGCVRDLPQISSRYEVPSSEIHVQASGTGITEEIAQKYNAKPQIWEFIILYYHPVTGKRTAPNARNAIKWVQVEM